LISLQPVNATFVRDFARDANFRNLNQYLYERRLQHFYRHLHEMNYGKTPGVLAPTSTRPSDGPIAADSSFPSITSNAPPPSLPSVHSPAGHNHKSSTNASANHGIAHSSASASERAPASTFTAAAAAAVPSHLQHLHHLHQTQQTSNSSAEDCELPVREAHSSLASTAQRQCKLPRNLWHQLSAGNNKCCYNVAFSPDGRKIGEFPSNRDLAASL
jgi:hypothetical protein